VILENLYKFTKAIKKDNKIGKKIVQNQICVILPIFEMSLGNV
jgi:hypothetical protein